MLWTCTEWERVAQRGFPALSCVSLLRGLFVCSLRLQAYDRSSDLERETLVLCVGRDSDHFASVQRKDLSQAAVRGG